MQTNWSRTSKGLATLILVTAVSVGAVSTALAGSVTGTIQVSGTRVKTEGSKSDKDVVIFLEKASGGIELSEVSEKASIDQKGLVFSPHVLAVQKGATVEFLNSDTEEHNVFCPDDCCRLIEDATAKGAKFLDLGRWGAGETRTHTFDLPGEGVLLCKLHPEMAAHIVVLETPYFVKVQVEAETQSASFSVENVPPGDYLLKTWNKKCESEPQPIQVGEGSTEVDVELTRKKRRR